MSVPKLATDERRIILLNAAARVAKSLASILDPDELLQRTVDIICDEFGFYYAGVFLLDESSQWAVLRAGRGEAGKVMIADGHQLKVGGTSMIGTAIAKRQARIALDVGTEAVHFQNLHLPNTRSEMALPLISGNEPIGALSVQSEQPEAFTQEDIAALQSMADQLAVAIRNSHLHRQNQDLLHAAQRRATLLEAAHEVGCQVTSILDLDELLPRTVDIICDAYGLYYAGVFLLDESGDWAVLRAGRGAAGRAMLAEGHKLQVGGQSMIGAAIYLREARIALDVGAQAVHFKNRYLPFTRSEMAMPLVVGDKVLGAVTVQSREEQAFSQEDITTLQTMADALAIAIHNALMIKELERAHARLLRTKTFEALATATTEAIHWIGNKALPLTTSVRRMQAELQSENPDLDSIREDLVLAEQSAAVIVEIKEQLLGPVRECQPRPVVLSDVARVAANSLGLAPELVRVQSHPGTPLALADSTQLGRALSNMLQNAVEAQAKHIWVDIRPAPVNNWVLLRLGDDGEGISPEILSKIWASFFTTKGPMHHGLGLAACLHIITQMDGTIQVESQPGEGTTFTLLLPAAQEVDRVQPTQESRRVLVIAPQGEWGSMARQTLQAAGHPVQLTSGVEMEQVQAAEVILLDETLAQEIEALQRLNAAGRTILVAAMRQVEAVTRWLQAGVKDVALKPYTAVEFERVVRREE